MVQTEIIFFSSVTQDEEYVYFNLADGSIITLPKQKKENIQFEDLQVKVICCKKWDTNNDGELSYAEAAAVTAIGYAFRENPNIVSIVELKYFTSISYIGIYAFFNCSWLWKITIPANVKEIQDDAFHGCKNLQIITIPNGVTSIGNYAFKDCNALTSITIPNSVTYIGNYAFKNCNALTSIYCKSTTPPTLGKSFLSNNNCKIYVPTESVDAYKTADGWKDYADSIEGYNF